MPSLLIEGTGLAVPERSTIEERGLAAAFNFGFPAGAEGTFLATPKGFAAAESSSLPSFSIEGGATSRLTSPEGALEAEELLTPAAADFSLAAAARFDEIPASASLAFEEESLAFFSARALDWAAHLALAASLKRCLDSSECGARATFRLELIALCR